MPYRTPPEARFSANNYLPLPVTLVRGAGVYLWDDAGKRYLDMLSAYSAVNHGHCHPTIVKALTEQAQILNVPSRAFYSEILENFLAYACTLTHQEKALPMNSGAEAVETAIKAARKWAYTVKKVPEGQAEIIVCDANFHGRTTTIISFSSDPKQQRGFGPFTPGFTAIPYGDSEALADAITPHTAAFLVEPIQGEGGINIPPPGYLKACQDICRKNRILLLCDEIQTGLGRTGALLACDHEKVQPDGLLLGKALGGGILPVSLFLSSTDVMGVFTPGDHGSTFGGNVLAATVGHAALQVTVDEKLAENAAEIGGYFIEQLHNLQSPLIKNIRGKGLFIGMEIDTRTVSVRDMCLQLMKNGLLTKDAHGTVIRLCPPLIITREQIDEAVHMIENSLKGLEALL